MPSQYESAARFELKRLVRVVVATHDATRDYWIENGAAMALKLPKIPVVARQPIYDGELAYYDPENKYRRFGAAICLPGPLHPEQTKRANYRRAARS
jgi:hypothetical protein